MAPPPCCTTVMVSPTSTLFGLLLNGLAVSVTLAMSRFVISTRCPPPFCTVIIDMLLASQEEQTYSAVTEMVPSGSCACATVGCVLSPITTSSKANAAKAAEILTYLFIIFPFHGCLVSGPAEDGEGGLWATPGLRTPVAPTGLGHQGPALERVPHRLTQSRRFVRLSVNAGWPPPFGSNTTNGVSPAAPALAKILSIARYLPRDPIGL